MDELCSAFAEDINQNLDIPGIQEFLTTTRQNRNSKNKDIADTASQATSLINQIIYIKLR